MPTDETSYHHRQRIGFTQPPLIRMEEEERGPEIPVDMASGRAGFVRELAPYFEQLMDERRRILEAIDIKQLSPKDKFRLLEENRTYMTLLRGGSPYKFATERVIYSILAFSGIVLVILASLTAFKHLPVEVTTTFAGTVIGGTIATIAQKLGKVGR